MEDTYTEIFRHTHHGPAGLSRIERRLSAEIIVNLSEDGVDNKVFKDLMCYGLDEITAGLTC